MQQRRRLAGRSYQVSQRTEVWGAANWGAAKRRNELKKWRCSETLSEENEGRESRGGWKCESETLEG